jgi:hypothetical protein
MLDMCFSSLSNLFLLILKSKNVGSTKRKYGHFALKKAKIAYGGSILSSSPFSPLPQWPQKNDTR